MWPKALAQLIELAPHVSRLLPMADRFFQNKTAGEDASRRAMDAMAEGLRGDLGQVTAAHVGLYRQLSEQSEKLTEQSEKLSEQSEKLDLVSSDARSARQAAEALEFRLNHAEARLQRLTLLAGISILLLVICLVLLIWLLLRPR